MRGKSSFGNQRSRSHSSACGSSSASTKRRSEPRSSSCSSANGGRIRRTVGAEGSPFMGRILRAPGPRATRPRVYRRHVPDAHIDPHAANILGACGLAVADALRPALADEEAGGGPARSAALVALLNFASGAPVDVLRRALGLTHSRTVRIVDALAADGLVRRRRSPRDGRVVLVDLTASGRRAAGRIERRRAAVLGPLLCRLDAPEQDELARLLGKVLAGRTHSRDDARAICRLCDAEACGHHEGRCPVTIAADAAEAARG